MIPKRTIGTARHSKGLYILDDNTSSSSISKTSLLSTHFSTSEYDFMLMHFQLSHSNFTYMKYFLFHLFSKIDVSSLYLVMCVFEQNNIGFHFSPNHINPYNRLPLSIMTFEVLSKVTTLTGKQWFVTSSLMIMSILPRSTLLPINLRFPLFSKTYITPLKHNFIQKLQFFGVIMVENSKTITLVNS